MSGHSKWSTIKQKKGKTDAERSKYFSKLSREIAVAAKLGGTDVTTNFRLKAAIAKAKSYNMPTDKINSVLKKTTEPNTSQFFDLIYEGYGIGGVAVIVNCLTDNKNRTSSDIRSNFDKYGGSLSSTGGVMYMFDKKGVIEIEKNAKFNLENAIELAINLDALDYEEDNEVFTILTQPNQVENIYDEFVKNGYNVQEFDAKLIPQNYVELNEKQLETFNKMIDKINDLDDVQQIVHNLQQ